MLDALYHLCRPLFAALDQEFGGRPQPAPCDDLPEPPPSADPMVVVPAACDRDVTEPLFVRRGAGRGARYDVATPGEPGTRYRREVVGRRRKFIPLENGR